MNKQLAVRIAITSIIIASIVGIMIGAFVGSRSVEGYDISLLHHRMMINNEYNYCPYCGEYIGGDTDSGNDN